MELSPELTRLAWVAGGVATVSLIGLVVGLSLLLGTMRHRTIGLPLVWIFAALLTTFFPQMVSAFAPGYVFLFFCGMMVLQLIWVKFMVVETKGVPLEEIQKRLGIEQG